MEYIGDSCFCGIAIREIILPETLETIEETAFDNCQNLSVIWIDENSLLDTDSIIKDHMVQLYRDTLVGDIPLRELRQQMDVVIPEGVETIEERWFMNS